MEVKPIVSIRLWGGLCNNLFQIGAIMGYAEKYNCQTRIYTNLIDGNHHTTFNDTLNTIKIMFPDIFIDYSPDIKETDFNKIIEINGNNACTYINLSEPRQTDKLILLKGYFQSEEYFPKNHKFLSNFKNLIEEYNMPGNRISFDNIYFIHIRMGDYIGHYLHYLGYKKYLTSAIEYINNKTNNKAKFLICSNESNKQNIINELGNIINLMNNNYIFENDVNTYGNPLITLINMAQCSGGIGVNSSFSWFGGYLCNMNSNNNAIITLPNKWFNEAYISYQTYMDIYPKTWKGLKILEI